MLKKSITFHYFLSIQINLYNSQLFKKLTKAIYMKLLGLSKKTIDYAIKIDI